MCIKQNLGFWVISALKQTTFESHWICQLDCDRKMYNELYKNDLNASSNSFVVNKPALKMQNVFGRMLGLITCLKWVSSWLLHWMTEKKCLAHLQWKINVGDIKVNINIYFAANLCIKVLDILQNYNLMAIIHVITFFHNHFVRV